MKTTIIPYNPKLKEFAKELRNNSTLSEVLLWQNIKNKALGVQFHRQVPLLEYIVDFYCSQLHLVIEIDGNIHDFRYIEDAERQGDLERYGITFIRFSNQAIKNNIETVLYQLKIKIEALQREQGVLPEHMQP